MLGVIARHVTLHCKQLSKTISQPQSRSYNQHLGVESALMKYGENFTSFVFNIIKTHLFSVTNF